VEKDPALQSVQEEAPEVVGTQAVFQAQSKSAHCDYTSEPAVSILRRLV
jgi:hypothetical protein